jgi:predicted nucleic acid-binding protein
VNYLIDTNIISEVRKADRCDPKVSAWYASIGDDSLYLSVLVVGEIRKGIELARTKDPAQANALEKWLAAVIAAFGDRILQIDDAIAEEWGRMSAKRPVPTIDGLLAATAAVHDMTLVTRNTSDVANLGARILDPFE